MAQPFDRSAAMPALGPLDTGLNQFWLPNPSMFPGGRHNLSAYERNRVFLSAPDGRFRDLSYLAGADSDGDGRAVAAGDFNEDGRMDLLVRQVGGGPLLLYQNRFPLRHWLTLTLRGRSSNRHGIGARVELEAGGQRQVRELFPVNSFKSRGPTVLHFGLGDQARVGRLRVRWPSGLIQELTDLAGDRHLRLTEGEGFVEEVGTVVAVRRD